MRSVRVGGVLAMGLMAGGHVTRLGIEVQGDHGMLFKLAITVLVTVTIVVVLRRKESPIVGDRLSSLHAHACNASCGGFVPDVSSTFPEVKALNSTRGSLRRLEIACTLATPGRDPACVSVER